MILYSVKYRFPGESRWTKVRKVKGDTIESGMRILFLHDESQIHLPLEAVVMFSKQRFELIKEKANKESGGVAQVNGGMQ